MDRQGRMAQKNKTLGTEKNVKTLILGTLKNITIMTLLLVP